MKCELTRVPRALLSSLIPAAAIAIMVCTVGRANPTLLITELSDTELTVTLDGTSYGTVTNVGPDHWEWRSNLIGNELSLDANDGTYGFYKSIIGVFWGEPSEEGQANFVGLSAFDWNGGLYGESNLGLTIYSDIDPGLRSLSANGTLGFWNFYGRFNSNTVFGPFDVVFSDQGDSAKVPDSASTAVCLGFAAALLLSIAKFRRT